MAEEGNVVVVDVVSNGGEVDPNVCGGNVEDAGSVVLFHVRGAGGEERCAGESISDGIVFSWHEFNIDVETHHLLTKSLDPTVGNLRQVFAEDALQGPVVSEDVGCVGVPSQVIVTFLNCVRNSQGLQFDGRVAPFGGGGRTGPTGDDADGAIRLLLGQQEAQAVVAGVGDDCRRDCGVVVTDDEGTSE